MDDLTLDAEVIVSVTMRTLRDSLVENVNRITENPLTFTELEGLHKDLSAAAEIVGDLIKILEEN